MADFEPKLIKKFVRYEDGQLYWRVSPGFKVFPGDRVGWQSNGRLYFTLFRKRMAVHRAIWILFNGPIPKKLEVDHINRQPHDNRLENLRLATRTQNMANTGKKKNKKYTRHKGVYLHKNGNYRRWKCFLDGRNVYFNNETEAAIAYNFWAKERFGEYAHLNEVHIG